MRSAETYLFLMSKHRYTSIEAFSGITSDLLSFKLVGQQERTVEPFISNWLLPSLILRFWFQHCSTERDPVKKTEVSNRDTAAARHQLPLCTSKISVPSLILYRTIMWHLSLWNRQSCVFSGKSFPWEKSRIQSWVFSLELSYMKGLPIK